MKLNLKLCLVMVAALFAVGCPPTPTPPPVDADATPSPADGAPVGDGPHDVYSAACSSLASLGCPEGQDSMCHDKLAQVVDADLTPVDLNCVINAKSSADVRKCGSTFKCGATK